MSQRGTMTTVCWWLVDVVSRLLEPDEREAVRGDCAESGETGGQALGDVLGLVVRRQAALWMDWRPWLALVGIVGVLGVVLTQFSHWLSAAFALRFVVYYYDGVSYETGLTVGEDSVALACQCMALMSWAWTGGFVLGSLSRRTIWVTGSQFYVVWLFSVLKLLWRVFVGFPPGVPREATVFAGGTLILHSVFVLPWVAGMYRGFRVRTLALRQAIILAAEVVTATMLAVWTKGWWDLAMEAWSKGAIKTGSPTWSWLTLAMFCWPIGYMVATASSHRFPKLTGG